MAGMGMGMVARRPLPAIGGGMRRPGGPVPGGGMPQPGTPMPPPSGGVAAPGGPVPVQAGVPAGEDGQQMQREMLLRMLRGESMDDDGGMPTGMTMPRAFSVGAGTGRRGGM